ncbi:MAG: Ig-like domain-containing protein, partial [Betaproteobacteria bacterium]
YQNGSTGTAPQYLYLGQANGTYSSASTAGFPTFTSTRSLVADFDGDGDPDILLQKGVENTPLFYSRNDGNLTFTEFENLAGTPLEGVTASSTISARVADFDVDGDFDLWLPAPVGFASAYLRQDSARTNAPPTGSVTIAGTATQGLTLTASDTLADADGLGTIGYQWLRDGGTIAGATNTIYLLTQADVGKGISVRASYTDGFGTAESATSAATAAVANVNDVPEAAADSYTVAEDAVLAIAAAAGVLANDSDVDSGDTLEAILGTGPTHGSLSLNLDGSLSYTPNADFSGSDGFTYRARDRAGALSNLVAVTLVVNPINDAPVAQNDSATVAEDLTPAATGNVATNDSDIDSSTLTVLDFASGGTTAAAGTTLAGVYGSLLLNGDGSYVYSLDDSAANVQALNTGDTATDTFTYRVSDGSLSATATLAVTLQGRDDTITGDGGNDVLTGSAGRDTLTGGGGNDTISGGAGNDVLTGGSGSDVLDGGTGDDLLLAASEDGVWSAGDVAHNPYTRASARLEGRAQSLDRFDGGEG